MKLAVMQPYLFPYIGYFQLIHAADLFLIYDDVSYIKQGYINRNSVLSPSGVTRFTVPVPGASSNKFISELKFSPVVAKILKTIEQSYSKAPYFEVVFPMIRDVLEHEDRSIASVCQMSYETIFSYIGSEKKFKRTSNLNYDRTAPARDRLIGLCHKFKASCYINTPGGRSLYKKEDFSKCGVDLKFLCPLSVKYRQMSPQFVPNLSIIDILMSCSPDDISILMKQYELD